MREYYQTHKRPSSRVSHLWQKYGLTLEEYEKLQLEQNGLCAICKKLETRKFKGKIAKLSVDHDHITGKYRGLLCNACNTGLGKFQDNILVLEATIEYLKKNLAKF